jgi:exopolysaccharide production protein ExoZ
MFYLLFGLFHYAGRLREGLALWATAIAVAYALGEESRVALDPIDLEFFFGVGAAVLARKGLAHWGLAPAALACFVLWGAFGLDRNGSTLVGLGFGLLIPLAAAAERAGRLRVPAVLRFLGAASYSIYLVHGLAISLIARFVHGPWFIFAAACLFGALAGIVYYLGVERPLLRRARTWIGTFDGARIAARGAPLPHKNEGF